MKSKTFVLLRYQVPDRKRGTQLTQYLEEVSNRNRGTMFGTFKSYKEAVEFSYHHALACKTHFGYVIYELKLGRKHRVHVKG